MHDLKDQHGAVMLLVAMLASTLLLLAGLAIDSAVIANSKIQQRHAAEYMALGALKAFNGESSTDKTVKLNTATTRAQQLAQENHFLAKNFLVYNTPESIGTNLTTGANGKITPGIWYFKAGSSSCNGIDPITNLPIIDPVTNNPIPSLPAPCPCDSIDNTKWAAPCFRELDYRPGSTDLNETPNSMRVELKTASNSPVQTLFARVGGQQHISISSSATAVQVPRRAVFLVDLSRHSHNETHLPYQIAVSPGGTKYSSPGPVIRPSAAGEFNDPRFASEYSFKLSSCPATRTCPTSGACTFEPGNTGTPTSDLYNTIYNYSNPGIWLSSINPPTRITENNRATNLPTPQTRRTKHFKSDYLCFNVPAYKDFLPSDTSTASINLTNQAYLIDTYYGNTDDIPARTYDGPEPLNSMLVGLNEAINKFKENTIPSDEITAIGFDGSASIDIRRIGPTAIDSNNTVFQELEDISKIELAGDSNATIRNKHFEDRFTKHLFFPRVETTGLDKQKNIPEALKRAKEVLISAGSVTSENFVVLISDGVTSCYDSTDTSPAPVGCGSSPTPCRICSSSYEGFSNSLEQAKKIINDIYIPNNIKFHFIQIGLRSSPHYLQRVKVEGSTKSCMSIEDMEKSDPPFDILDSSITPGTESAQFLNITYGGSFVAASEFGRLAKLSKGKYLPIRSACQAGTDITASLEAECNNPALGNGDVVDGAYSDSKGRLTCDSLGRDRRAQIKDAISEIFNVDPYIIVD